jgi:hypothetical protein
MPRKKKNASDGESFEASRERAAESEPSESSEPALEVPTETAKPDSGFPTRATPASSTITATIPAVDGKPDFKAMRESSRNRLKELFNSPEFQKEFSLGPIVREDMVAPEFAAQLLNMIASAQAMVIAAKCKVPVPVAMAFCRFRPEEIEKMSPPTRRLIAKYMPAIYSKYGDEFALGSMLVESTMIRVSQMNKWAKDYHDRVAASRLQVVQPINGGATSESEDESSPVSI